MSPVRRVPSGQVWRAQGLEWSQTPGGRGTASTTRNDADFDIQVDLRTDENMSSSHDPSSGLNSAASVCRRGEQHDRRDQVVDAFRSDRVDTDEREAQEISALLLEIGIVTGDCVNPRRVAVSQF